MTDAVSAAIFDTGVCCTSDSCCNKTTEESCYFSWQWYCQEFFLRCHCQWRLPLLGTHWEVWSRYDSVYYFWWMKIPCQYILPFLLSPHKQTQLITSLAGALIFVATQARKTAIIIGVVNHILQRLPMEGALPVIGIQWVQVGARWLWRSRTRASLLRDGQHPGPSRRRVSSASPRDKICETAGQWSCEGYIQPEGCTWARDCKTSPYHQA